MLSLSWLSLHLERQSWYRSRSLYLDYHLRRRPSPSPCHVGDWHGCCWGSPWGRSHAPAPHLPPGGRPAAEIHWEGTGAGCHLGRMAVTEALAETPPRTAMKGGMTMSICFIVFNQLRPRQNGHRFADDIFKCIFSNENVWILIKISLKFVPWCRPGDKPLSEPMMASLLMYICVTWPQWVKTLIFTY